MFLLSGLGTVVSGQAFNEYSVPTVGGAPVVVVTGPDGALWFTENSGNKIGRITADGFSGIISEFILPTAASAPLGITAGPDGALWFTENSGNKIGRITTAGVVSEFTVPTAGCVPYGIALGPDGAIWFSEFVGNKIGRITTGGVITEFAIPTAASLPLFVVAGPDGALWFTENSGNKIGRITTDGVITEFIVPTASGGPGGITGGPDGAVWFTEGGGNKIGRITTTGAFSEFTVPTASSQPIGITTGSDGALWFTEFSGNQIGRITTTGVITEFATPTASSQPSSITAGPDGALWFTEYAGNKIGRRPWSAGLTVNVLGPSTGTAFAPLTFTANPNGGTGPYTFGWACDFHPGSPIYGGGQQTQICSYPIPGLFTVVAKVTDVGGAVAYGSMGVTITGLPPPAAGFTITGATRNTDGIYTASAHQSLTLTATEANASAWTWDFGDGTSQAGKSVAKTYSSPGTFVVRLAVAGDGTLTSGISTSTLTLNIGPCAASATSRCLTLPTSRLRRPDMRAFIPVGGTLTLASLSATTADPFMPLTLTGSGFDPTARTQVSFSDAAGYSVAVVAVVSSASTVTVAVPPYFDPMTSANSAAAVNVQVAAQTISGATLTSNVVSGFQIGALPVLTMTPGTITANFMIFLRLSLSQVGDSLLDLEAHSSGQVSFSSYRADLENAIAKLSFLEATIRSTVSGLNVGSVPTHLHSEDDITFTPSALKAMDQNLFAVFKSATSAPGADPATGGIECYSLIKDGLDTVMKSASTPAKTAEEVIEKFNAAKLRGRCSLAEIEAAKQFGAQMSLGILAIAALGPETAPLVVALEVATVTITSQMQLEARLLACIEDATFKGINRTLCLTGTEGILKDDIDARLKEVLQRLGGKVPADVYEAISAIHDLMPKSETLVAVLQVTEYTPEVAGISCTPTTVPPGQSSTCTVTMAIAPIGRIVVPLSNSSPGALSVPPDVTVYPAEFTGTFPVTGLAQGTATITAGAQTTTVTIASTPAFTGSFTGMVIDTVSLPPCSLRDTVSFNVTASVTGSGSLIDSFNGTFNATNGSLVISVIANDPAGNCYGDTIPFAISGPVSGSSGKIEVHTHTTVRDSFVTVDVTNGVISGNTFTGTIRIDLGFGPPPIQGTLTLTRQ